MEDILAILNIILCTLRNGDYTGIRANLLCCFHFVGSYEGPSLANQPLRRGIAGTKPHDNFCSDRDLRELSNNLSDQLTLTDTTIIIIA